jgi:DNA-directed RNA polymerase subunit RPC12/RpoP
VKVRDIIEQAQANYDCPRCEHTIRLTVAEFRAAGRPLRCPHCRVTTELIHSDEVRAALAHLDACVRQTDDALAQLRAEIATTFRL